MILWACLWALTLTYEAKSKIFVILYEKKNTQGIEKCIISLPNRVELNIEYLFSKWCKLICMKNHDFTAFKFFSKIWLFWVFTSWIMKTKFIHFKGPTGLRTDSETIGNLKLKKWRLQTNFECISCLRANAFNFHWPFWVLIREYGVSLCPLE